MICRETLERWCTPVGPDGPYLRPFVCRGPMQQGGAFIVGVNPATTIFPADTASLSDYAENLTDIARFLPLYDKVRAQQGKTGRSATRMGLDTAAGWLVDMGYKTVLDTNISPRPTKSEEEWERLPGTEKAMWVFPEVVAQFQPSTVILHGKSAYEAFTDQFAPALRRPEKYMQVLQQPRLGTVKWPFGGSAHVFVCRHLLYFKGSEGGKAFAGLKAALSTISQRQ